MNNTYILFVPLAPVIMFFIGFLIARHYRTLENVPLVSLIFVKYRFFYSSFMGVFMSLVFSVIFFASTSFITNQLFISIVLFLLTTFGFYYGMNFGWGRSLSDAESNASIDQPSIAALPENIIVENTLNFVRITINSQKRWFLFVIELFQLIVLGVLALPILGLILISALQKYLPQNMNFLIWILAVGLVLYLLYAKFQEALEYVFDREVIEFDNLSVRIEKYGLGFRNMKEYSADNIKKITTMFSFAGTNVAFKRSRFMNKNMPAFMMWHSHGLKRYRTFGRAVDLADAQMILETVYSKFPQYRD